MAYLSATLFLIFNIFFFGLTHGQGPAPSPEMNSTASPPADATSPSPAMNSTTSPPPAMNSTASPPPAMNSTTSPPPDMNSTTSPPPAMNSTASPPPAMNSTTSPPQGLNCSGCRVNPIGLASCGFVINGGVARPLIRLCCRALQSLTREEGIACLCNVIKRNPFNIDIVAAVDKAFNACSNV